jgi:hypothetical protein
MNYFKEAIEYHRAGLKVIPFWNKADGKKQFPYEYAKYRDVQTEADVTALFAPDCDGVCLLCTDGIEAVDIDSKHDPKGTIKRDLSDSLKDFDLGGLPVIVQRTKSGGYHWIYKCPEPGGNLKLAHRRGYKEAMIETRGDGGLLFVAPTPGYEILNGSLADIHEAVLTQEQRDSLIRLCRHFDEPDPVQYEKKVRPEAAQVAGEKPWEAFDKATDILAMMENYGWRVIGKRGEYVRLNRPGAKHSKGVDGTVIESYNVFYPFTSSAEFEPNKGYSPSAVFAVMEHRGNFSDAARALYKMGFGDRIEKVEQEEAKSKLPDLIAKAQLSRFNFGHIEPEPKPILKYEGDRAQAIAGRGMIGVLTGHEKSGKSFVGACMAASALCLGREVLNFSLDLDGGTMLWFDTEQGKISFNRTQRRIYRLADCNHAAPNYHAFNLRRFSPAERIEVIEHMIYNTPGVSVVMIDGFVDLIGDYNDLKGVQEYVGRLMKWSDERQILILGVLHVNKGDGKIRGHIGSELKNKCDFIVNVTRSEQGEYVASNPTNRNYMNFADQVFTRDAEGMPVYDSSFNRTFGKPGASSQFPTVIPNQFPASAINAARREEEVPF